MADVTSPVTAGLWLGEGAQPLRSELEGGVGHGGAGAVRSSEAKVSSVPAAALDWRWRAEGSVSGGGGCCAEGKAARGESVGEPMDSDRVTPKDLAVLQVFLSLIKKRTLSEQEE